MNTVTELLSRALDCIDWHCPQYAGLREEIRAFLEAEPEAEPLEFQEILDKAVAFRYGKPDQMNAFLNGVKFSEKHHGIGGDD